MCASLLFGRFSRPGADSFVSDVRQKSRACLFEDERGDCRGAARKPLECEPACAGADASQTRPREPLTQSSAQLQYVSLKRADLQRLKTSREALDIADIPAPSVETAPSPSVASRATSSTLPSKPSTRRAKYAQRRSKALLPPSPPPDRELPPHTNAPDIPLRGPPTLASYSHFVDTGTLLLSVLEPSLPSPPIATLAHGLERVLFNPGVHFLRDPRSGVYNFSPSTLENVPRLDSFDFSKLPEYITSSRDEQLMALATSHDKTFVGSTSTTVGMLCQVRIDTQLCFKICSRFLARSTFGSVRSRRSTRACSAPNGKFRWAVTGA